MNKQKLAELVMQKMMEKKQLEERNRPHHQVLQLFVTFQIQKYFLLTSEIQKLKSTLESERNFMETMEQHCLELQNTGKKPYPRIIIKPEFIASENIKETIKEFYRKSSNTFLRQHVKKGKGFQAYQKKIEDFFVIYGNLKEKQIQIEKIQQKDRKITNDKRVSNLKQDLRFRGLKDEQAQISQTIQEQIFDHKDLISEYDLKKGNLQNRMNFSDKLSEFIERKKQEIQRTYNPLSYRNYLKRIFSIRTKNQMMQKNLFEVVKDVGNLEKKTHQYQVFLEAHDNLFIEGKCHNSPSKKKRGSSLSKSQKKRGFQSSTKSLKTSRIRTQIKANSQKKFERTPQKSMGRTAASSMANLMKSSRKRLTSSQSMQQMKNLKRIL